MTATSAELFTCFRVSQGPVRCAVAAVQDDIVENIKEQPDNSSTENEQWQLCLLGANIPFDSFHQDAEHQGHGKNGVAKRSHHVCPKEAVSALPVLSDVAGPQAKQADDHGEDMGKDGERIRGQGQGVAHVGDHELHHEQQDAHDAHED